MWGTANPAKTNLVIKRYAVGLILGINKVGNLCGVRCYHYFNGNMIDCDCKPDGKGWFVLSRESQAYMARNMLHFDEEKLNQQKELVAKGVERNPLWT
jgi:hypothetical protein